MRLLLGFVRRRDGVPKARRFVVECVLSSLDTFFADITLRLIAERLEIRDCVNREFVLQCFGTLDVLVLSLLTSRLYPSLRHLPHPVPSKLQCSSTLPSPSHPAFSSRLSSTCPSDSSAFRSKFEKRSISSTSRSNKYRRPSILTLREVVVMGKEWQATPQTAV